MLDESLASVPPGVLKRLKSSRALAEQYRRWDGSPVSAMSATARSLHARVRSFVRRERNMAEDLLLLSAYEEVVAALAPWVQNRDLSGDFEFLGVIFEAGNRLGPHDAGGRARGHHERKLPLLPGRHQPGKDGGPHRDPP